MQINKIAINNFGSYEGLNTFDFCISDPKKNVILIGGKNGAGKTTLFTAMRLALYGPIALGYETTSPSYYRNIKRLINTNSLSIKDVVTSISIEFTLEEERESANYCIHRQWQFEDKRINESLSVKRNDITLNEDELAIFESYIQSLIPPQLFDLFFFDGEKISEFFLNGNSKKNLKEALLVLCGYDTFEIIRQNFRRLVQKGDSELLNEQEENYKEILTKLEENKSKALLNYHRLGEIEAQIMQLEEDKSEAEKQFKNAGGLLAQEIESIKSEIFKEEKFRDEKNEWLRDFANDTLPFLIASQMVKNVKEQVLKESKFQKYTAVKEALDSNFLMGIIDEEVKENDLKITTKNNGDFTTQFTKALANHIDQKIRPNFDVDNFTFIHSLSHDAENDILALIKHIEKQDVKTVKQCKEQIVQSINRVQQLRKRLEDNENNDYLSSFIDKINTINVNIYELSLEREKLTVDNLALEDSIHQLDQNIRKLGEQLSILRKENSVLSLCTDGYYLLDNMLPALIAEKLESIKDKFVSMFNQLLAKQNYVDEIDIDPDFNITLYRQTLIDKEALLNMIFKLGLNEFITYVGSKCIDRLKTVLDIDSEEKLEEGLRSYRDSFVDVPMCIDFDSFSKGEQQIYIMALYWSMVKLSQKDIPFTIDTPYARIDSMHRENITTKFFPNLSSQVIILSTDEEVNALYYSLLHPYIAKQYTISYSDNEKRTFVTDKYFFEVAS